MTKQSPTTWRLTNILFGSLFLLLSNFQWDTARSNGDNWQAGFLSAIGATQIASVFFKRQSWAWEDKEK